MRDTVIHIGPFRSEVRRPSPHHGLGGHLLGFGRGAWQLCVREWTIRRDERLLLEMPEAQLRDIGITRANIGAALRGRSFPTD